MINTDTIVDLLSGLYIPIILAWLVWYTRNKK
nr:MAG TPA: hypothetical protein [Ackermannviridae sp.]